MGIKHGIGLSLTIPYGGLLFNSLPYTSVSIKTLISYLSSFGVSQQISDNIPSSFSKEYQVTSKAEFSTAIGLVQPGECIRIQDGVYTDWGTITWTGIDGTQTSPIYVLPETVGGVTFTGEMYLRIYPGYVYIHGFKFIDCDGSNQTLRFEGNYSKFIRNYVENLTSLGIGIYADFVEVFNNTLYENDGTLFVQPSTNPATPTIIAVKKQNHYHHNTFTRAGPNPGGNAGSPISLGFGFSPTVLDDESGSIVEYNYFDTRADGEIITVKSNSNIIRYNWFEDGRTSHISIRMGSDNLVYGNILTGMNVVWRWSGERNKMFYNIATSAATSSNVAHLVGHVGSDTYRASVDNEQQYNILIGFDKHAELQAPWEELTTPRPSGNITQNNLFLDSATLPNMTGQGDYDETEYLSSNTVSNNTVYPTNVGNVYSGPSSNIDFSTVLTETNSILGLITIDPKGIPWIASLEFKG